MPAIDSELAMYLDGSRGKPRLLVVDDQPSHPQALYRTLADEFELLGATTGEEALALCRDKRPDLVLLDVVGGPMDAHALCTHITTDTRLGDVPVIIVAPHDDPVEEARSLTLGAVDVISKPINPVVLLARLRTHAKLKVQTDILRKLVFIDGLTGVFNRRYLDHTLSTEWLRSERSSSPLALALIDVDCFRRFNETYGHQAGDDCLRKIAACLRKNVRRPADVVVRHGGEAFACLLPDTDLMGAMIVAQLLEQEVRELAIPHETSDVAKVVTVSLGVAAKPPGAHTGFDDLLALADAQLHMAKMAGKGQVCGEELPS